MATTKTIEIKTYDENNHLTTYRLDNPKENLTKPEILSAFAAAIEQGILLSNYGETVTRIGEVSTTESIKTIIEGAAVYFTPANPTIKAPSPNLASSTVTVQVSNAPVQAVTVNSYSIEVSDDDWTEKMIVSAKNTDSSFTVTLTNVSNSAIEFNTATGYIETEIVIQGVSVFLNINVI